MASTEATGAPVPSASATDTVWLPVGVSRTRSAAAPAAYRETPVQEKGSRSCPDSVPSPEPSMARECIAASNRAGCRPNLPASAAGSSGRRTSAKTSSPRRHTDRRPWKAGP